MLLNRHTDILQTSDRLTDIYIYSDRYITQASNRLTDI